MIYNSISFFVYFSIFLVVYYTIPSNYQKYLVLIFSSVFIALFSIWNLVFVLSVSIINYILGLYSIKFKYTCSISIVLNILLLIAVKLVDSFNFTFISIIGYSYYLLSVISYFIEIKRGNIEPERNFISFLLFLLFFAKFIQGPIERPKQFIPQTKYGKSFDPENLTEGLRYILLGLFKKLVVADRIAIYVTATLDNYPKHSGKTLLLSSILYSFQIYADFSGYSDIALGVASTLGIRITKNFELPYLSKSIKEFWTKWHISLSFWLRDYIFLPVSYKLSKYLNNSSIKSSITKNNINYSISVFITFTICGLWHGFNVNYLIWGLTMALFLILPFTFKKMIKKITIKVIKGSTISNIFKYILVFSLMTFSWIIFRAKDMNSVSEILKSILRFKGSIYIGDADISILPYCFIAIALLMTYEVICFVKRKDVIFRNNNVIVRYFFYVATLLIIMLNGVFDGGQFIYQQF